MEKIAAINRAKYEVFRWRYELTIPQKLALSLGVACLIGLFAQIRIILPWSPVPITGQTFAVLLAAIFLGRWWGGISLAIYAGLGAAGVPWFAGLNGGLGYLAGPTGGYIIGFIFAALFLGYFTDTYIRSRNFLSMLALMLFANFILVYIPGLLQLGLWLNLVKGEPVAFTTLFGIGALPFIAGDIIKIVLAAAIARGTTPRSAYNG
jgi:biotin transport system substrate-specific component